LPSPSKTLLFFFAIIYGVYYKMTLEKRKPLERGRLSKDYKAYVMSYE